MYHIVKIHILNKCFDRYATVHDNVFMFDDKINALIIQIGLVFYFFYQIIFEIYKIILTII